MSAGVMQWKVSSPGGFALMLGVWVLMIALGLVPGHVRRWRRKRAAGRVVAP